MPIETLDTPFAGLFERRKYSAPDRSPHPARKAWAEILRKYDNLIPPDALYETSLRLDKAMRDYMGPKEFIANSSDAAFLIHTRRVENSEQYLDDPGRCFPALRMEYNIPYDAIEEFWNLLPPFEVGKIKGALPTGEAVNVSLISVPLTPQKLEEAAKMKRFGGAQEYARPIIQEAVAFAQRIGATTIGLGETLASLTDHARFLHKQFPELTFATGHAFTTYYMNEWIKYAAVLQEKDITKVPVTILGAFGSIGSSITELLAEQGVGKLILHDVTERVSRLKKNAEVLEGKYPYMRGRIQVTEGGDENLEKACKSASIIAVATSNAEPFLHARHLNPKSIIVNDSQPPGITFEEAQKAQSISPWVVGKLPEGIENTFEYGLLPGSEWTCALEVIAKSVTNGEFETVGAVTRERVKKVGEITRRLGFRMPEPQCFGKPIPLDMFQRS